MDALLAFIAGMVVAEAVHTLVERYFPAGLTIEVRRDE